VTSTVSTIGGAPRATWRYDLWRSVWMPVSRSPRWFPILPMLQRRDLRPCRAGDDLVIEGFPRSGNTFAVHAFLSVNPTARVSHHMHAPANVLRAVERQVPVIVAVRDPRDAVVSEVLREPRKGVERALREWISFYTTVQPLLDHVVIAPFEDIVGDFGRIVARVNDQFGTAFVPFAGTAAANQQVLDGIDARARERGKRGARLEAQVPRPSAVRDAAKAARVGELHVPAARRLVERAVALHGELVTAAR
jgi:hypothetical protein